MNKIQTATIQTEVPLALFSQVQDLVNVTIVQLKAFLEKNAKNESHDNPELPYVDDSKLFGI